MWVWEAMERKVSPSVNLSRAREILAELGFHESGQNATSVIFKRDGTIWTTKGEKAPMKLSLTEAHGELYIRLRYEGLALLSLFDSGDLDCYRDKIIALLRQSS